VPRFAQPLAGSGQVAARRDAVGDQEQAGDRGGVDEAGAQADREGQIGGGAGGRREASRCGERGLDLLGARGEPDHARRRVAAFGGGARERRDRLVRERERAVGDAVGDVDQRHRGDGARRAAQGWRGEGDGDAHQHQRAQQRLHPELAAREIGERPAREQPHRGQGEQRSSHSGCSNASVVDMRRTARSRRPPRW
jgi:hypothetical protein